MNSSIFSELDFFFWIRYFSYLKIIWAKFFLWICPRQVRRKRVCSLNQGPGFKYRLAHLFTHWKDRNFPDLSWYLFNRNKWNLNLHTILKFRIKFSFYGFKYFLDKRIFFVNFNQNFLVNFFFQKIAIYIILRFLLYFF